MLKVIRDTYLLDINHTDGGSKAKPLLGFGFEVSDVSKLNNAIREHASNNEISKKDVVSDFGEK